MMFYRQYC